jgi:hypothetical protein
MVQRHAKGVVAAAARVIGLALTEQFDRVIILVTLSA